MYGLLGNPSNIFSQQDQDQAMQSGLLGLASGLLSAGMPSRIPVGIGAGFGQGLAGFGQAQSDALTGSLKAQQAKQQMDMNKVNLQKALYDLKREQDWYGGGQPQPVGYPQPNGEVLAPAGPMPAMGGTPDATGATPASMAAPGNPASMLSKLPPDMQQYVRQLGPVEGPKFLAGLSAKQLETGQWADENQGGVKGQRNKFTGEFKPYPAGTLSDQWEPIPGTNLQENKRTGERKTIDSRANTTINMPPQRKAEDEIVGKEFGQMYVDLQKNSMQAPSKIAKLDRINSLLSNTYTGLGGEANLAANKAIKSAGDSLGLDTSGISDKVAAGEAAQALSREIALGLRNPTGGAGMPGALSNSDRDYLASMTPNLGMTPQGRTQLIDAQKKLYVREQEVARMARAYRQKHGNIDEGFFNQLDAFSKANPLFKAAPSNNGGGGFKYLGKEGANGN